MFGWSHFLHLIKNCCACQRLSLLLGPNNSTPTAAKPLVEIRPVSWIVLEGLRGEDSIAGLCRREGMSQNLYYHWSKEFLEAGKKRLAGDTARGRRPRRR